MDNDATVPKRGGGSVALGLVLGVLTTVVFFTFGGYLFVNLGRRVVEKGFNPFAWVIFFGAFQWIYILPLVFILRAKQRPRTATGLLIVGLLVVVANMALIHFWPPPS